jgi:hypothetical protein
MKTILLLLSLLVSAMLCTGQTVASNRMNILYYGIQNSLSASAYNYPCKAVILKADTGKVSRYDDGNGCYDYEYIAPDPGTGRVLKVTFTMYAQIGKKQKTIGKSTFRIKELPIPDAFIGGKRNDTLNIRSFKAQEGIIAKLLGFDIDAPFKVDSFRYIVISNDKMIARGENKGNVFTQSTRAHFSTVNSNDVLLIYNIFCTGADKRSRKLEPFELRLTQ